MSTFSESRDVTVDADTAAAVVLDWSRDPGWRSAVGRIEVRPEGRAVEGQRIVEHLRFLGLHFVTPTTVLAASEREASFSGGSATVQVSGLRRVTALTDRSCRVDIDVSVRLRGPLAPLTALLAPAYRRRHAADLDRLCTLGGFGALTERTR